MLQNRAATDFLLLAQGRCCEDFEGTCSFNLSDHSELIHKRLDWLKEHVNGIRGNVNPFATWLKSLFGDLSPWLVSLIKEGLRLLLIVLLIIVVVKIAYFEIVNIIIYIYIYIYNSLFCIVKGVTKMTNGALLVVLVSVRTE